MTSVNLFTITMLCDYTYVSVCLFVCLFKCPNVFENLIVFTLKSVFFTKQNGPPYFFLVEIYSCSREWYWNFSMFFDELWNNKKKMQSLPKRNQKVKAEAEVWGMSNQFSHMHLNVGRVQSRPVGRKQQKIGCWHSQRRWNEVEKEWFYISCFSACKKHHTLRSVMLLSSSFACF